MNGLCMASLVFRCPALGVSVQGWISDDGKSGSESEFIGVACTACRQVHLVNAATGRVLGDETSSDTTE